MCTPKVRVNFWGALLLKRLRIASEVDTQGEKHTLRYYFYVPAMAPHASA
jgi:hypothetical protein